jgi:hypothetical protein
MPNVEAFMGLAQLGLGFAGFSGIALALATREHEFVPSDRALVRFLVLHSLGVAGLAVLPVVGGMLDAPADLIWRASSMIHVACALAVFWPIFGPQAYLSPPFFLWSMRVNLLVCFVLQLLNTTGWLFSPSGGVYFLAVFLILPGTAFAFGRLLFEFLRRRAA